MARAAFFALALFAAVFGHVRAGGFKVSGTDILDASGNKFVMRGINYPHSWYKNDYLKGIPAIAATGANVIRIVLADGDLYTIDDADSVADVLDLCKEYGLVAIVEAHDGTGNDDVTLLNNIVDYWINLASVLKGREDYVILNIANEWMGTSGAASTWAAGYIAAIPKIRNAGITNMIMVDSPGWGQDASAIAEQGINIFNADSQKNVVFSIHMYEVAAPDAATVKKNIDNSLAIGVPVVIGEFATAQNGSPVAYKAILEYTAEKQVGWLAWSWYGNGDSTAFMDMATGPAGTLYPIGEELVNGDLGIKKNAKAASF